MSNYDLFLGSPDEIRADIETYLMAIKRMLPRWANSLPDSEYQIMGKLIGQRLTADEPVFVETGIGATTLLFLHYAMERGGRLISWDMNGSKATFIRTVASETLERLHGKAISSHWTFVQASTSCPYTGTGIIGELTDRVNFSHHDSDHTWSTISGEVGHLLPYFQDGGIICVDDANQIYQSTYEPIINMTRRKLGLDSIPEIEGNRGKPHCDRIPELIGKYFGKMKDVTEGFEEKLSEDLYYQWYAVDRQKMNQVGMERMKQLVDRFVAYQIEGKL